jgi:hypothetical protein
MKTSMKSVTKWMLFGKAKLNPYLASTMARFHYTSESEARATIIYEQQKRIMKLSAGQSKVIEALYK